jgi:hypothetical protein
MVLLKNGVAKPSTALSTGTNAGVNAGVNAKYEDGSAGAGSQDGSAKASSAPLLPLSARAFAGKKNSIVVAGPIANNGPNTFGNYACDAGNCSTSVTSILGGLVNASAPMLNSGEVTYIAGCSSTSCNETDFSAVTTAAKSASLAVVVLGTLGWDRLNPGRRIMTSGLGSSGLGSSGLGSLGLDGFRPPLFF